MKNSTSVAGIEAAMPLKIKIINSRLNSGLCSGFNIAGNAFLVAASVRSIARGEKNTLHATIKKSSGTKIIENAA